MVVIILSLSDKEIVQLCLDGNGEAYEEIIRRYNNKIYNIAYRFTGNAQDSLDITQEIFIKIYNSLKKYCFDYKFSSWLLKTTTNYCLDYKKKKTLNTISIDSTYERIESISAEQEFIQHENEKTIINAINKLPNKYKILIELYHHQNMSYGEISEQLGLSMTKVKNRLYRARLMLKEELMDLRKEVSTWNAVKFQN